MKQNDAVMNIRIATELHDQLKALAKKKYMPLSVMVRLALIDYITHEAPSVLLSTPQPQTPQRKPMSAQEFKFMREQQMRGADISAIRPQSPSQQNELSEDDWV
jgi:hypothetical protein